MNEPAAYRQTAYYGNLRRMSRNMHTILSKFLICHLLQGRSKSCILQHSKNHHFFVSSCRTVCAERSVYGLQEMSLVAANQDRFLTAEHKNLPETIPISLRQSQVLFVHIPFSMKSMGGFQHPSEA